jgi:hypothetical protein
MASVKVEQQAQFSQLSSQHDSRHGHLLERDRWRTSVHGVAA